MIVWLVLVNLLFVSTFLVSSQWKWSKEETKKIIKTTSIGTQIDLQYALPQFGELLSSQSISTFSPGCSPRNSVGWRPRRRHHQKRWSESGSRRSRVAISVQKDCGGNKFDQKVGNVKCMAQHLTHSVYTYINMYIYIHIHVLNHVNVWISESRGPFCKHWLQLFGTTGTSTWSLGHRISASLSLALAEAQSSS